MLVPKVVGFHKILNYANLMMWLLCAIPNINGLFSQPMWLVSLLSIFSYLWRLYIKRLKTLKAQWTTPNIRFGLVHVMLITNPPHWLSCNHGVIIRALSYDTWCSWLKFGPMWVKVDVPHITAHLTTWQTTKTTLINTLIATLRKMFV